MSQSTDKRGQQAEALTQETRSFMRHVRATTRRRYTAEEKIRIVLEGFRRETTVNDLCRREGIKPGAFYAWTKDFMVQVRLQPHTSKRKLRSMVLPLAVW